MTLLIGQPPQSLFQSGPPIYQAATSVQKNTCSVSSMQAAHLVVISNTNFVGSCGSNSVSLCTMLCSPYCDQPHARV